jgi:hypothetical protein
MGLIRSAIRATARAAADKVRALITETTAKLWAAYFDHDDNDFVVTYAPSPWETAVKLLTLTGFAVAFVITMSLLVNYDVR